MGAFVCVCVPSILDTSLCASLSHRLTHTPPAHVQSDHLFELNYAITLYNNGEQDKAREHFLAFKASYEALDDEAKMADADVAIQGGQLAGLVGETM